MEKIRTFVAIEIPSEIQEKINELQIKLKPLAGGISWVRSQNIHLTLKFLGEIDQNLLGSVISTVTQAAEGFTPFQIKILGAGFFPNAQRPRVIWVGCEETSHRLLRLQTTLENSLATIGFEKEKRKFSPHLTIGRVKYFKNIAAVVSAVKDLDFNAGEFDVRRIVVMRSQLHPGGSIYTPLGEAQLGSAI